MVRTMSNEPMVSVAVITYNMSGYLRQLLDSILVQKVNFPYEVIIDDDHSPDNSREILYEYKQKFPDIIKLSLRETNVGGSRNMYGVLRQCQGKYIAILEGDDYWDDDNKLQYQFDFMETHPQYIGMNCDSWCEESRTETIHHIRRNISEPMVFTYQDFMKPFFFDRIPNSTDTLIFRNIFKMYPDHDFSVFYKAHNMVWDQSLALILYGFGDVYVDPKVVSHHRTIVEKNGTNYQSRYAREDHKETDAYMYACHEEYIENVLHRKCNEFYKVRGDIFSEAFFIGLKNRSRKDMETAKNIWNQRKKKGPLIQAVFRHGIQTVKRKMHRKYEKKA